MVRALSVLFCLTFICFAALQYNDPDPIFWTVVYLSVAAVSFLRIINRHNKRVALVVLVSLIFISLFYLQGFFQWLALPAKSEIFGEMAHEKPYIEETREFIGLIMAMGSVFYQYKKT